MNGKFTLIIVVLITFYNLSWSQEPKELIRTDGLYVAKTKEIELDDNKMSIYTYLRFYDDNNVYSQAVSAYAPEKVTKWFGKNGRFEKSGMYSIINDSLKFSIDNNKSPDIKLEGPLENSFGGIILDNNNLLLKIKYPDNEVITVEFEYVKDKIEFSVDFNYVNKIISIPGNWKEQQVIQNGQVFLINEDSTTIGIVVYKKERLPVYKKGLSSFETARSYFTWDSEYLENQRNMDIEFIEGNTIENYVIWNAKDEYNNNYYLFGCDGTLIYNYMIYNEELNYKDKVQILKEIYKYNID